MPHDTDAGEVTRDGSPVPVYLAVPAEPGFTPVLGALTPPASVLDLGCGVGRLANPLAARGHEVVGVDESEPMLAHLDARVTAVCSRIERLRLSRRFDAVVLASHLVNTADDHERRALLATARRHVTADGEVLVEHYEPERKRDLGDIEGRMGPVDVSLRVVERRGDVFDGRVEYRLDGRRWEQTFTARLLDEGELDRELAAAGLRRRRRLSPRWLVAGAA